MTAYQASSIKPKRFRSTKTDMATLRVDLFDIVAEMHPMTVRQVFYQATVRGLVDKSEAGYSKVQGNLSIMRRSGMLRYDWLADNTRWQRKPQTFDSVQEAFEDAAHFYRKALWTDINAYVEIWLEKDALSGVIMPVTEVYDVPLMVARGYASLSFLYEAGSYINDLTVPAYIYHLGDFDPSGVNAGEKIEESLREYAPDAELYFERIAVTPDQIKKWGLPTRPTKTSDTRSKGFGDISVELDAIAPDDLRNLVEQTIQKHLPKRQLKILQAAEESERQMMLGLVSMVADMPLGDSADA